VKIVVVGNGTSLSVEQLNLIHQAGIPSIACNRINLIYPETDWRPTFYVHPESLAPDVPYIQENVDTGMECYVGEHFLKHGLRAAPNVKWIKDCHHHLLPFHSDELPDEWHMPQPCTFGGSVNFAMQIAVQKGFDDLILIGCDLRYKTRNRSHFSPAYEHGGEQPPFYAARNAFFGHVQALNYIRRRKLNVTVTNATEGGQLELWQRASLQDAIGG
jgi:hypothetical protein